MYWRETTSTRAGGVSGLWYCPWLRLRSEHVAVRGAEFESNFKVILFDHVGAGGSDLSAYDQDQIFDAWMATPTTWWKSARSSG